MTDATFHVTRTIGKGKNKRTVIVPAKKVLQLCPVFNRTPDGQSIYIGIGDGHDEKAMELFVNAFRQTMEKEGFTVVDGMKTMKEIKPE